MKKLLGLIAVLFLANQTFARGSSTFEEEPTNFVDQAPSSPVIILGNSIPTFCPVNSAQNANTQNFSLSEFHSKDGEQVPISARGNIQQVINQLQKLRNAIGLPIVITSGYRSVNHNSNVGGVPNSHHLCGMAADFYVPGMSNDEVQNILLQLIAQGVIQDGGVGRYNNFTHYDVGAPRRWDKR